MNELKFHLEFFISCRGGLAQAPLHELNHRLNRIPFSAIGGTCPIDRTKEMVRRV